MHLRTQISNLEASWLKNHNKPAFKIPLDDGTWKTLTYADFYHDVQVSATHWYHVLQGDGIAQRSVVGLCIRGYSYTDLLHLYGLFEAGYVPQPFSVLPNADVIGSLLSQSKAKALIWDESYADIFRNAPDDPPVKLYMVTRDHHFSFPEDVELPPQPVTELDDIAFISHTSGSTSGSPKLVLQTYRWMDTAVAKARQMRIPSDPDGKRRPVRTWLGSICHTGQMFMTVSTVYHGGCTVLPPARGTTFSSAELISHITEGSSLALNELCLFPALLSKQFHAARDNPLLLYCFQKLDAVFYGGNYLPAEDIEWACRNGIKLMNFYGSTECGLPILMSDYSRSDPRIVRIPAYDSETRPISYRFEPIHVAVANDTESPSKGALLELVIKSDSGDCPHPYTDFYTGDLFEEAGLERGCYIYKGRDDDWIKMANALRCDTSAIEQIVRALCSDLISECVVVGSSRPSPALIVESENVDIDKAEIFRRIEPSQGRMLMHERVQSPRHILVVSAIPRTSTKGNVRRKAAEDVFKAELDGIYEAAA
ncbi:ochratoxin a non-ribosomal peptide synthetase [Moniliophthora roreri MCA 2997]|uniref:Ochratoxin a non-ribosomal peptide synthetase n=2 Tax=Moniliophthora roreri TaxID=221103 RepID=V2YBB7_MONRO|nr:ochratoxin a non-ribosomal peptide synthetase [Moniliophthora roreri MCA 2997]KAI3602264.1 ochratoxin a non-ribosomal peptide synthetase [Moniliophthora roreri]